MRPIVCDAETAELEVHGWLESLDVEPDPVNIDMQRAVKLVRRDMLRFLPDTQEFVLHLYNPVKLDNGDIVEQLKIREPNGADMQASSSGSDVEQLQKMLSKVSGLPLGVVQRIGMRDQNSASMVITFFV